jgi:ATP-dependent Clp protease ATP-binding subunit ClpB
VEDTIAILRGLKERYEVHHGVRIQDGAIVAAATLSNRYITDRFLPDKAIDLVDEAASRIKIELDSMPTEIDVIESPDHAGRDGASGLEEGEGRRLQSAPRKARTRDRRPQREVRRGLKAQWMKEKESVEAGRKMKEEIDRLRTEFEQAQRRGDFGRAGEIQYGLIPDLEKSSRQPQLKPQNLPQRHTCCAKKSPRKTSPASSRTGPAFPSHACRRANARSS